MRLTCKRLSNCSISKMSSIALTIAQKRIYPFAQPLVTTIAIANPSSIY